MYVSSGPVAVHTFALLVSLGLVIAPLFMVLTPEKHCRLLWQEEAMPKLCGLKLLTGHDCPGCGMTRCFVCMAHGDVVQAVKFHPWGAAFYVFLLIQIPYRLYALYRIHANLPGWYWQYSTMCLCIFFGLYFVQWIIRLALGA